MRPQDTLEQTQHRPWPVPDGTWSVQMVWEDLLFAHWPWPADQIQAKLPQGIQVDTFDDSGWIGVVPFGMRGVRPRWVPEFPPLTTFLELNVRTYVRVGGKPGVWFFSLDAANKLAVRFARWQFNLPYFDAEMRWSQDSDQVVYSSQRTHRNAPTGNLRATYGPIGPVLEAPSDFDRWLTERYCLYSTDRRARIYRGEIHHLPWPLQKAEATFEENTVAQGFGFELKGPPTALHFAKHLDVVAWSLSRCDNEGSGNPSS